MPYPQCLDLGAVVTGMENMALSTNGVPASVLTTIPNVAASKILAFGQSSQVHPVIAIAGNNVLGSSFLFIILIISC